MLLERFTPSGPITRTSRRGWISAAIGEEQIHPSGFRVAMLRKQFTPALSHTLMENFKSRCVSPQMQRNAPAPTAAVSPAPADGAAVCWAARRSRSDTDPTCGCEPTVHSNIHGEHRDTRVALLGMRSSHVHELSQGGQRLLRGQISAVPLRTEDGHSTRLGLTGTSLPRRASARARSAAAGPPDDVAAANPNSLDRAVCSVSLQLQQGFSP